MEETFTLEELAQFVKDEKQWCQEIFGISNTKTEVEPDDLVISSLLRYSQSLSIRKTKRFGKVEMVLN